MITALLIAGATVAYFAGAAVALVIGAKQAWRNVENRVDAFGDLGRRCSTRPSLYDDGWVTFVMPILWPVLLPLYVFIVGWVKFYRRAIDRAEPLPLKQQRMPDLREEDQR